MTTTELTCTDSRLCQNGESPQLSFSVKSEVLDIQSWGSIRQFEAVKGCLQGGLQEHLKYNNVLRAILDLPETLEERVIDRVSCRLVQSALKGRSSD
jgi:hypothetical protein